MGYAEQNLMPGEEIIYKAKLHWAMFVSPIIFIILAIVLGIILVAYANQDSSASGLYCFAGLIFLTAIIAVVGAIVSYSSTEFALTNKRLIAKIGFINHRSIDLLLTRIESISVTQPSLGRMLDYGTVIVTGTGGTKQPFRNIAAPMELRKRVNLQIAGEG